MNCDSTLPARATFKFGLFFHDGSWPTDEKLWRRCVAIIFRCRYFRFAWPWLPHHIVIHDEKIIEGDSVLSTVVILSSLAAVALHFRAIWVQYAFDRFKTGVIVQVQAARVHTPAFVCGSGTRASPEFTSCMRFLQHDHIVAWRVFSLAALWGKPNALLSIRGNIAKAKDGFSRQVTIRGPKSKSAPIHQLRSTVLISYLTAFAVGFFLFAADIPNVLAHEEVEGQLVIDDCRAELKVDQSSLSHLRRQVEIDQLEDRHNNPHQETDTEEDHSQHHGSFLSFEGVASIGDGVQLAEQEHSAGDHDHDVACFLRYHDTVIDT